MVKETIGAIDSCLEQLERLTLNHDEDLPETLQLGDAEDENLPETLDLGHDENLPETLDLGQDEMDENLPATLDLGQDGNLPGALGLGDVAPGDEEPEEKPEPEHPEEKREMTKAEVEDVMNAPMTEKNMDLKFKVMLQILNKELPMPDKIKVCKRKRAWKGPYAKGLARLRKVAKALRKVKAKREAESNKASEEMAKKKETKEQVASAASRSSAPEEAAEAPEAHVPEAEEAVAPEANGRKRKPACKSAAASKSKRTKGAAPTVEKEEDEKKKQADIDLKKKLHSVSWLYLNDSCSFILVDSYTSCNKGVFQRSKDGKILRRWCWDCQAEGHWASQEAA